MEKIIVFQQKGSGEAKIKGVKKYGRNLTIKQIFDIDSDLPLIIDEPEEFIKDSFSGDLVLSFLKHPDLLDYLASICSQKNIPVIASGQKNSRCITPTTCCGLGENTSYQGKYGQQFGVPQYRLALENERIAEIEVIRGAPCGATWEVIPIIKGMNVEEAKKCIAREVQYRCAAPPDNFDPVSGSSPLHFAGKIHHRALEKAAE